MVNICGNEFRLCLKLELNAKPIAAQGRNDEGLRFLSFRLCSNFT